LDPTCGGRPWKGNTIADEAAAALREEVGASIAGGIFGSPTCRVGDKLFFGVEKA